MTSKELINGVFSDLHEETGEYYATGTLGDGGSTTIFVASSLTGIDQLGAIDDFLNGKEIYMVDGSNAGYRREIVDWAQSTTTGIVNPAFPHTMAMDVSFVIAEKGFSSAQEILAWANDGAKKIVDLLKTIALWDYLISGTAGGTSSGNGYGQVTPPSDMHKEPHSIQIAAADAVRLGYDELERFLNDPFTPTMIIRRAKNLFWYKPDGAATITFKYPPIPATITVLVDPDLPSRLHPLIRLYCVWQALLKKERPDLVARKEADFVAMIKAMNEMVP